MFLALVCGLTLSSSVLADDESDGVGVDDDEEFASPKTACWP